MGKQNRLAGREKTNCSQHKRRRAFITRYMVFIIITIIIMFWLSWPNAGQRALFTCFTVVIFLLPAAFISACFFISACSRFIFLSSFFFLWFGLRSGWHKHAGPNARGHSKHNNSGIVVLAEIIKASVDYYYVYGTHYC